MSVSPANFILSAFLTATALPSVAQGRWTVGKPYELGQPIGLDQRQENAIVGSALVVSHDRIRVCGKEVPVRSVAVEHLTEADFLARYNFVPRQLGFPRGSIEDVSINSHSNTNACGKFADPGTHMLVGANHAIVEVGNDYFELRRSG